MFFCFSGHDDEILDVSFDYTGQYIVTGSADGSGRVYNATTHQCVCKLEGHDGEISKVYRRLLCNVSCLASLEIVGCSDTSIFMLAPIVLQEHSCKPAMKYGCFYR